MNSAICTLFENHYHYGVAALTNSLFSHGYRGNIYAGYKGELPSWANKVKKDFLSSWPGSSTLFVAEDLQLHFLPVKHEYHLANYKPRFMIQILEDVNPQADSIAYFDPDIINKCRWDFYEEWMGYGVALVYEFVTNPMPSSHPVRLGWEKIIKQCGAQTVRKLNNSFNSGFCGVSRSNIEFLKFWERVIEIAIKDYQLDPKKFVTSLDRSQSFSSSDQDALNIAAMGCETPLSELGPDGMDFIPGGWIMSHAIGPDKPWKKNFIWSSLMGSGPSRADKAYWLNLEGPIKIYDSAFIRWKNLSISTASFISRFYQRK